MFRGRKLEWKMGLKRTGNFGSAALRCFAPTGDMLLCERVKTVSCVDWMPSHSALIPLSPTTFQHILKKNHWFFALPQSPFVQKNQNDSSDKILLQSFKGLKSGQEYHRHVLDARVRN